MTFSPTAHIISVIAQSEVTDINKQKFLAELAKLLTFMYEEDRQEALAMYAGMFEAAEDEQALLQALVSPTRQAVVIARAYNAKERKLQVHAQSRDEGAESGNADFIRAIQQVFDDAVGEQSPKPAVDENQLTLFDDLPEEPTPAGEPEEPGNPAAVPAEDTVAAAVEAVEMKSEQEAPVSVEEVPAAGEEADSEPAPVEEAAATEAEAPASEAETVPEKEDPAPANVPAEVVDEVDAFLADFTLPDDVADSEEAPEEEEEYIQGELIQITEGEPEPSRFVPETVRKPKVFLLILYILFAIPLTLAGVVLLLVPTLLFLLLAAVTIGAGVMVFSASFSGFVVFADMLVVLGTAIIVLALGLLFLWIFIWFIGGAIVGLIRSVIELGDHWCYKEVPAE